MGAKEIKVFDVGYTRGIPRQLGSKRITEVKEPTNPVIRELLTPEQWLQAAKTGTINTQDVIDNLSLVPENSQEEVLIATGIPTA